MVLALATAAPAFAEPDVVLSGPPTRDDYEAGLRYFRPEADHGDAVAQYNLGRLYSQGRGAAPDFAQAIVWFRKAAEQGHPAAQARLGEMLAKGQGAAADSAQAEIWYRKSAAQGNADAVTDLLAVYAQAAPGDGSGAHERPLHGRDERHLRPGPLAGDQRLSIPGCREPAARRGRPHRATRSAVTSFHGLARRPGRLRHRGPRHDAGRGGRAHPRLGSRVPAAVRGVCPRRPGPPPARRARFTPSAASARPAASGLGRPRCRGRTSGRRPGISVPPERGSGSGSRP